jgi:hypothetical protein
MTWGITKRLFCLLYIGSLFLIFYSPQIFALREFNRQWTDLFVQGALFHSAHWRYTLEAQSRFDIKFDKIEEEVLRTYINYQFTPNLILGLGYQWDSRNFITGRRPINRIIQHLIWTPYNKNRVNITHRERVEERKREYQVEWNTRFRHLTKIEIAKFFANKYAAILWDEVFVNCNKPPWVHTNTLEQNRLFVGFGIPTSKSTSVQIGYLNQYIFSSRVGDVMNHILFIGYSFKYA